MPIFSRPIARPGLPYRDTNSAIAIAILTALVAGWGMAEILAGFRPYPQSALLVHFTAIFSLPAAWWEMALYERPLAVGGWYASIFIPALLTGTFGFIYGNRENQPYLHIRGRRLLKGKEARKSASAASAKAISREKKEPGRGAGIKIGEVQLSRSQEVESIILCGAQGSGKTVVINNILNAAESRGDKLLIFDLVKGDYTSSVPRRPRTDGKKGSDTIILSPWDRRSWVWAIGYDIQGIEDANSFAVGLIKGNDDDPMWSDAARAILVAGFIFLIQTHGRGWGWRELAAYCFLPIEKQKEIVDEFYPIASASVADAGSKTTQSIKINLSASLFPVWDLARRWAKIEEQGVGRFSLRSWMKNDNSPIKKVIIQGNSSDSVLTAAFARSFTEYLTSQVCSLQFQESLTRRIWVFLDELPQLGRLSSIARLMEVGRSKGIAVVFGFQSIDQVRQIYPRYEEDKWMALFGLRIFPRIRGNASQKWVSDEVGIREVERRQRSVSSGKNASLSDSYQRHELPVILPAQLESEIGPRKDGVEALVLGHGQDALILKFPYPQPGKKNTPYMPAETPGFGPQPPMTASEAAEKLGIPPLVVNKERGKLEREEVEKNDIHDAPMPPTAIHGAPWLTSEEPQESEDQTNFLQHQLVEAAVEEARDESIARVEEEMGLSHEAHSISLAIEILDALPGDPTGTSPPVVPHSKKRKRRSRYQQPELESE